MASTRHAMHALEDERVDYGLASTLVSASSESDALIAFSLLRGAISDRHLVMLVNLRELLLEMPTCPFSTPCDLEILARACGYEDTGRSYRRGFESNHGVFGLEFVGRLRTCEAILVHTPLSRFDLYKNGDHELDAETLTIFAHHATLIDAAIEALQQMGLSLDPKFYLSAEDFLREHQDAAGCVVRDLFQRPVL